MKKFLNYFSLFVLILLIIELMFGYLIFQRLNKVRQDSFYSSVYKVTRYLYKSFQTNVPYIETIDNSGGVYPSVDLKKKIFTI